MPRRRRPPRPGALADTAPLRIFTQIVVLQIAYYVCAAFLIIFTALVAGKDLKLDLLLSWRTLRGDITVGWMLGLVWLLNSLFWSVAPLDIKSPCLNLSTLADYSRSVIFLLLLVARSKMIPDFALTIHLLHLIVTSVYTRAIPTNWFWWGLQIMSAGLMTSLGIWSCQYRELQPIKFGRGGTRTGVAQGADGSAMEPEEDAVGFGRGRGRGKGRDGAGEYEMLERPA